MDLTINMLWDNEACVWVATSDDIPGLVLEMGSFDGLVERLRYAIPELLELNSSKCGFCDLNIVTNRHVRVEM